MIESEEDKYRFGRSLNEVVDSGRFEPEKDELNLSELFWVTLWAFFFGATFYVSNMIVEVARLQCDQGVVESIPLIVSGSYCESHLAYSLQTAHEASFESVPDSGADGLDESSGILLVAPGGEAGELRLTMYDLRGLEFTKIIQPSNSISQVLLGAGEKRERVTLALDYLDRNIRDNVRLDTALLGLATFLLTFTLLHAVRFDTKNLSRTAISLVPMLLRDYVIFISLIIFTAHLSIVGGGTVDAEALGSSGSERFTIGMMFFAFTGQLLIDGRLLLAYRAYPGRFKYEVRSYTCAVFIGVVLIFGSLVLFASDRSAPYNLWAAAVEIIAAFILRFMAHKGNDFKFLGGAFR